MTVANICIRIVVMRAQRYKPDFVWKVRQLDVLYIYIFPCTCKAPEIYGA
jgi:hypothetical protein